MTTKISSVCIDGINRPLKSYDDLKRLRRLINALLEWKDSEQCIWEDETELNKRPRLSQWMTIKEAALELSLTERAVQQQAARKAIDSKKEGRKLFVRLRQGEAPET